MEPAELVVSRTEPGETVGSKNSGASDQDERDVPLRIINESHEPVTIKEMVASCGCTVIGQPSKQLIEPGSVGLIPLRVSVPSTGERTSRVSVVVEGPFGITTVTAMVKLRGHAIDAPALISLPEQVSLNRDAVGRAVATIRVRTYETTTTPWIRQVTSSSRLVAVDPLETEDHESPEPGTVIRVYSYSIRAEPQLDDSQGDLESACWMMLHAEPSGPPIGKFPIRVHAWRPMRLVPSTIFVHADDSQLHVQREIRVQFTDQRFVAERVEAESSAPWIDVRNVSLDVDREAVVSLCIKIDIPAGRDSISGDVAVQAFGKGVPPVKELLPVVVKRR
jgi:hypothetical protein